MSQFELFEPAAQPTSTAPDVAAVRSRLRNLLDTLAAAETMPLTEKQVAFWRTVVPQMTNWLPDDEKASVLADFEAHLTRLTRRAA